MVQLRDRLADIYIEPASEAEAQMAIDAAMALTREIDLVNWFSGSACRLEYLTPLFFDVFDYYFENQDEIYWHWPNVWNPECGNVWADPRFKNIVEKFGFVEYWREVGWPKACRPEGDAYTCGAP